MLHRLQRPQFPAIFTGNRRRRQQSVKVFQNSKSSSEIKEMKSEKPS